VLLGDDANETRAYQILKILTDPEASRGMCATCSLCDADSFDKNTCINYSMSIGKFLGVNKSLVATKLHRIRVALARWLLDQESSEAHSILEMIPNEFKA
jgi:hypothetical protein